MQYLPLKGGGVTLKIMEQNGNVQVMQEYLKMTSKSTVLE